MDIKKVEYEVIKKFDMVRRDLLTFNEGYYYLKGITKAYEIEGSELDIIYIETLIVIYTDALLGYRDTKTNAIRILETLR